MTRHLIVVILVFAAGAIPVQPASAEKKVAASTLAPAVAKKCLDDLRSYEHGNAAGRFLEKCMGPPKTKKRNIHGQHTWTYVLTNGNKVFFVFDKGGSLIWGGAY